MSIWYKINGEMGELDETYMGQPIFRKYTQRRELQIVEHLGRYSHPNIVSYLSVSNEQGYLDMEMLDVGASISKKKMLKTMSRVKDYLQSIGILYIDWKEDQVGIDRKGRLKLFDFDASGIIDLQTKEWILEPPKHYWSYRQAIHKGLTDPYEIDNFGFSLFYS